MAHFKPFYYLDDTDPENWRRIFVEPNRDGGVDIEIIGKEDGEEVGTCITLPPLKFETFADRCVDAYETLMDDEDWIGEAI